MATLRWIFLLAVERPRMLFCNKTLKMMFNADSFSFNFLKIQDGQITLQLVTLRKKGFVASSKNSIAATIINSLWEMIRSKTEASKFSNFKAQTSKRGTQSNQKTTRNSLSS